eukprot:Clim_evm3s202 gene=Clim_evmTU3s202
MELKPSELAKLSTASCQSGVDTPNSGSEGECKKKHNAKVKRTDNLFKPSFKEASRTGHKPFQARTLCPSQHPFKTLGWNVLMNIPLITQWTGELRCNHRQCKLKYWCALCNCSEKSSERPCSKCKPVAWDRTPSRNIHMRVGPLRAWLRVDDFDSLDVVINFEAAIVKRLMVEVVDKKQLHKFCRAEEISGGSLSEMSLEQLMKMAHIDASSAQQSLLNSLIRPLTAWNYLGLSLRELAKAEIDDEAAPLSIIRANQERFPFSHKDMAQNKLIEVHRHLRDVLNNIATVIVPIPPMAKGTRASKTVGPKCKI